MSNKVKRDLSADAWALVRALDALSYADMISFASNLVASDEIEATTYAMADALQEAADHWGEQ